MAEENQRQRRTQLTPAEAAELELALQENPEDLTARGELLQYYMMARYGSDQAGQSHFQHLVWFIEHHPDADVLQQPWGELYPGADVESLLAVRQLWIQQAANYPETASILGSIARFSLLNGAQRLSL